MAFDLHIEERFLGLVIICGYVPPRGGYLEAKKPNLRWAL